MYRFPVTIDEELMEAFKAKCAAEARTPTLVVRRLIEDWVANGGE